MRSRILLTLFALACISRLMAQPAQVLFTYGKDTVYKDEFVRVFLKNNKKEEQTDSSIQAYLNLYINFKLKVKEAVSLQMDTSGSFKTELKGYRDQLAKSYMTDTSMTSKLIDEAYERMKYEVNASHILILCNENTLPKDTLSAWKKINELRKKALSGSSFDTLAFLNSEDPSAKSNLGNLGYFSAFDMIYPFENQAFNTPVGEVSQIFRTSYGYHILKVNDKRSSRGEVRVAHLMIKLDNTAGEKEILEGKRKIDSIAARLNAGADWKEMVASYSEDPGSKSSGGELNWFSSMSRISEPFKEAAFRLTEKGAYSAPVKTEFGWHIIRLLDRRGLAPKQEILEKIRSQVNRESARMKMNQDALITKLKKENGFENKTANIQAFLNKGLDSSMIKGNFVASQVRLGNTPLFVVGPQTYTVADFAGYLQNYQSAQPNADLRQAVEKMLNNYIDSRILAYEESMLEAKYPAFRYLMEEYHDGILLFNLTEKVVWNKAIEDTTGLKNYYDINKNRFTWPDRINATIYEASSKDAYNMTKKLIKKNLADVDISQQVNKENPLSLVIKRSKFVKGEISYVDQVKWKPGTYYLKEQSGKWVIVKVVEFLPAGPKALNEVKGIMTGEYQNFLEQAWIEQLKTKYPVVIDQDVLNTLKP